MEFVEDVRAHLVKLRSHLQQVLIWEQVRVVELQAAATRVVVPLPVQHLVILPATLPEIHPAILQAARQEVEAPVGVAVRVEAQEVPGAQEVPPAPVHQATYAFHMAE